MLCADAFLDVWCHVLANPLRGGSRVLYNVGAHSTRTQHRSDASINVVKLHVIIPIRNSLAFPPAAMVLIIFGKQNSCFESKTDLLKSLPIF